MPYKTWYIDVPYGDDLIIKGLAGTGGEVPYLIRRATAKPRLETRVSNYSGDPKPIQPPGTQPPPTEPPPTEPPPPRPPPTEPPPDPVPGEGNTIFFDIAVDYPNWVQSAPYFEKGNVRTHLVPPPPAVGTYSIRMKQGNCVKPAGCFPALASATIRRAVTLVPGSYVLELYRVAHDSGEHAVNVYDGGLSVAGRVGTIGLNEDEWQKTEIPFEVTDGQVQLEFAYTAPAAGEPTGVKVAGIRVRKVS